MGYRWVNKKNLDTWIIKTDQNGDSLWSKVYGGNKEDVGREIRQTSDGGYIFTGYTESFSQGKKDVWLVKLDSLGDTVWTKTFGERKDEQAYSLDITQDGGYVITGYTTGKKEDLLIIKTDKNGNVTE